MFVHCDFVYCWLLVGSCLLLLLVVVVVRVMLLLFYMFLCGVSVVVSVFQKHSVCCIVDAVLVVCLSIICFYLYARCVRYVVRVVVGRVCVAFCVVLYVAFVFVVFCWFVFVLFFVVCVCVF